MGTWEDVDGGPGGEARERLPGAALRRKLLAHKIAPPPTPPYWRTSAHLAGVLPSVCTPAGGPTASHCAIHGGLPPPCFSAGPLPGKGLGLRADRPCPRGTPRLPAPVLPCLHHQSGEQLFLHPEPRHLLNRLDLSTSPNSSDLRPTQSHPGLFFPPHWD